MSGRAFAADAVLQALLLRHQVAEDFAGWMDGMPGLQARMRLLFEMCFRVLGRRAPRMKIIFTPR